MDTPNSTPELPEPPQACSMQRAGYAASPDEVWACRAAAVAAWCGESCNNSAEEMQALEAKGLVKNLDLLAGRGRYAGRYEYEMTEAGEAVAEAYLELLPKEWPHTDKLRDAAL